MIEDSIFFWFQWFWKRAQRYDFSL